MSVLESLKSRKSVRSFLDKEIPQELLDKLFDAVRWCPSSKNTQPWKLVVVSGDRKKILSNKVIDAFNSDIKPRMEYDYDGVSLEGELKNRAIECGKALYDILGIEKSDKEKRIEQWKKNYSSFGSPAMILIFKYPDTGISAYIDCGMILQSIMLAADELGLATCPQASLAQYPQIVKSEVGYSEYTLICGIAIGYEDSSNIINSYRTSRLQISDFVDFI